MPTIHKAEIKDSKRLSEIAEAIFRKTFAANTASDDMDLHCRTTYSETIQRSEITDPKMVTLLSKEGDDIIGFAQMRWGETPACIQGNRPGEIQRFYVVGQWHGKGVAQSLMDACIEEMNIHHCDVVWLGVWEQNNRALAFYRKFGFRETGDHIFCVGDDPQRDVILSRTVEGKE